MQVLFNYKLKLTVKRETHLRIGVLFKSLKEKGICT